MNQNQIEKQCKCGAWEYGYKGSAPCAMWHCDWQNRTMADGYCHVCGWYLDDKGIARRTVVVPEECSLLNGEQCFETTRRQCVDVDDLYEEGADDENPE